MTVIYNKGEQRMRSSSFCAISGTLSRALFLLQLALWRIGLRTLALPTNWHAHHRPRQCLLL